MTLTVHTQNTANPLTTYRTGSREPWQLEAACSDMDPELFFPEGNTVPYEARRACGRCLVEEQCRQAALTGGEEFGIWGGTNQRERRRARPTTTTSTPTFLPARAERDRLVLRRYRDGVSTKTIAVEIGMTERTVHRVIAKHRQAPAA